MQSKVCWLALIVPILLMVGCASTSTETESTPTPIPTPIVAAKPTYRVQRGAIQSKIQFSGRIVPVVVKSLFFRAAGRVHSISVKEKDNVKAGQVLADLETGHSEFDLKRARVNLEIAKLNLDAARAEPDSPQKQYQVGIKEREVQLAQITLDELEQSAAESQIVAPIDSKVLQMLLTPGRPVEAFAPVITVADVSQLEVGATLVSQDLQKLKEGMPATVVLSSRPGEPITGQVRRLPYPYGAGNSGDPDPTRIALNASSQAGLELGDLVQVTVITESKADALWLPPRAVRTFEGRQFVVVQHDQGQVRVDVRTGVRGEDRVEIVEGLTEGQLVIGP